MLQFVTMVVGVLVIGVPINLLVRRLMTRRHRTRGELEAALLVGDASPRSPRRRWRHLVVVPSAGQLVTRARPGSLGLRLPLGAPETILVRGAHADPHFRTGWRDAIWVNPSMRAVALDTADGPRTLLLDPASIPDLLARISGRPD